MIILSNIKNHTTKLSLFILAMVGMIGLDQWSKFWVVNHLTLGESKKLFPGIIRLTYLQNRGAAFSILQNQQGLFAVLTLLVILVAGYYLLAYLSKSWWYGLSLSLIIAGGLGNFIDRVRQGYVVDMIEPEFIQFAVFNIADACLSVGVALLFISLWREESGSKN
ncbi:signal peptidase II [Streptococcus sp. DD12]|uniref:signal peptidase II n=1 Tax=Streptococcus sp. DD12 TaxID=1777880 RepID=UPI000794CF0A|nr:signal peptidase II [Streptococcus sp. DD12]KXT76727.1 Lipoprotein signal peptidase [Streptococcus sp. DD12]